MALVVWCDECDEPIELDEASCIPCGRRAVLTSLREKLVRMKLLGLEQDRTAAVELFLNDWEQEQPSWATSSTAGCPSAGSARAASP